MQGTVAAVEGASASSSSRDLSSSINSRAAMAGAVLAWTGSSRTLAAMALGVSKGLATCSILITLLSACAQDLRTGLDSVPLRLYDKVL